MLNRLFAWSVALQCGIPIFVTIVLWACGFDITTHASTSSPISWLIGIKINGDVAAIEQSPSIAPLATPIGNREFVSLVVTIVLLLTLIVSKYGREFAQRLKRNNKPSRESVVFAYAFATVAGSWWFRFVDTSTRSWLGSDHLAVLGLTLWLSVWLLASPLNLLGVPYLVESASEKFARQRR